MSASHDDCIAALNRLFAASPIHGYEYHSRIGEGETATMAKMFDCFRPDKIYTQAAAVKAAGYGAVGFYLFESSGFKQHLTIVEAKAMKAAGLYVVSVFENGSPTTDSYFSAARGMSDASHANALAQLAGQPKNAGIPIYFAVDYDASTNEIHGDITNYFKAIHNAGMLYPVGCYGSGECLMHLKSLGLIGYEWLSQSRGFSGYKACLATGPQIVQGPVETIFGVDADADTTNNNAGGWQPE